MTMSNGAMVSEFVTLTTDDGAEIDAYYAKPAGEGPFPGVVVIQHIMGVDEWIMEVCRRFAHHGYAAVAPNLYARIGGIEGSELEELVARLRSKGGLKDEHGPGRPQGLRLTTCAHQPNRVARSA